MNITIDGTPLLSRKFGIGYYSENIIQALSETDYTNVYKILYQVMRSSKRELPCPPSSRFEPCVRRLPLKVTDYFFNTKNFSADFYCGSPDVFHGLSMFLPRLKRAKTIWTVHDLSFRVDPDWFEDDIAASLNETMKRNLDRADHVIAVSESTARDLVHFYGYPEDKITPVHHGICRHSSAGGTPTLRLPSSYVLCVSTIEPRKNLVRLIEAFSMLDTQESLVIAGAKGWKSGSIFRAIENSKRKNDIVWIDYVPTHEMNSLYRNASAFIYPSLYEGFGLPLLEALSHGCACLTSNVSSLPEVGGDAAVYFDPTRSSDIAEKLSSVIHDGKKRVTLCSLAKKQAAKFDWKTSATKTRAVYERAART